MSHRKSETADTAIDRKPIFCFTYRSIPFHVVLGETDTSCDGILNAKVGILPFTGDGEALRKNTLATIDQARRIPGYRVEIGIDHVINLSVSLPINDQTSAATILAAALEKLASAKSLLDLVLSLQPPHLRKIAQSASWNAA